MHAGAWGLKFFVVILSLLYIGGGVAGAPGDAPTLTSVIGNPNPAVEFETINITSVSASLDGNQADTNLSGVVDFADDVYNCINFVPNTDGVIERFVMYSDNFTASGNAVCNNQRLIWGRIFNLDDPTTVTENDYLYSTTEVFYTGGDSCGFIFDQQELTQDVNYFFCFKEDTLSITITTKDTDPPDPFQEGALWQGGTWAALTHQEEWAAHGVHYAYIIDQNLMCSSYPGGDYDLCLTSEAVDSNPSCPIINPVSIGHDGNVYCIAQNTTFNVSSAETYYTQSTAGFSEDIPSATSKRVGIYIQSREDVYAAENTSKMHHWKVFSAQANGANRGRIEVDGVTVNTCNYNWECFLNLDIGTHEYSLYSAIGNFYYSGQFTVQDKEIIKIYVPITYNVFDVYTNDEDSELISCSDLWSISNNVFPESRTAVVNKRISAGHYLQTAELGYLTNWNDNTVIPRNCYADSEINLNPLTTWGLPGRDDKIEPALFAYVGSEGYGDDIYALHFLSGTTIMRISGHRDREGQLNIYSLYEEGMKGYVEQKFVSNDEGIYSPIVEIKSPAMNDLSSMYGDANYIPGEFGAGENVTCEATLESYAYVIYDINFLLIRDYNEVFKSFSFSPFTKYYDNMPETQTNGVYNFIMYTFSDVNTLVDSNIQCAIQTTNEIGYKSGWAVSEARNMLMSNTSAEGGVTLSVMDEDGTDAATSRYMNPWTLETAKFDIFNDQYAPYGWTYSMADNPLTLYEGDGIIWYTTDIQSSSSASKIITVNRGDTLSFTLYIPDENTSDQNPYAYPATLQETGGAFSRIKCRAEFYDKDLDWNVADIRFWTSEHGSFEEPSCQYTAEQAYTSNCNPTVGLCKVKAAFKSGVDSSTFLSECGSANDCYVEKMWGKHGCIPITASSSVTGYCAIVFEDLNGNTTIAQASTILEVDAYDIFAFCDSYALVGGKKEKWIYTATDDAYVECEIGVEGVLTPDMNFIVKFEGETLPYAYSNYDDYLDLTTHVYKKDVSGIIAGLVRDNSEDGEIWAGEGTVIIAHNDFGELITSVQIHGILIGSRVDKEIEYSQADFDNLWDSTDAFLKGLMTDPWATITLGFAGFLLMVFLIIIFIPLFLKYEQIKGRSRGE